MKPTIPVLTHTGNGRQIQPGKKTNGLHKARVSADESELIELRGQLAAINKSQAVRGYEAVGYQIQDGENPP